MIDIKGILQKKNSYIIDTSEGKYLFDVKTILKYPKLLSKQISRAEFSEILLENNYHKILSKTYNWVLIRIRSKQEVKDYLTKQNLIPSDQEKILSYLEEHGHINDETFTKMYVLSYQKKHGIKKITYDLEKKGIRDVVLEYDELPFLEVILENKKHQLVNCSKKEIIKKLNSYGMQQGFSPNNINVVVKKTTSDLVVDETKLIEKEIEKYLRKNELSELISDEKFMNKLVRRGYQYNMIRDVTFKYTKDIEKL